MRITVTEEHIRKGCARDSRACPVAHALIDATGNPWSVGQYYLWTVGNKRMEIPEDVREFIEDFDAGKPVQPFSFELPVEPTEGGEQP